MDNVVIIGNGVAGITAARHIRKNSKCPVTVIGSESEHFYSRTALMYIFMGHMQYEHTKPYEDWFWRKNDIELVFDHVQHIDFERKSLLLKSGESLDYESLVLATGSRTATFGWKGLDLQGVSGLYSLQDMEQIERFTANCEQAVIVGGGLIGVELAEMLHSREIPVTMLIREEDYWHNVLPKEEASLIRKHLEDHGIVLKLATELREIKGETKVEAVVTSSGETLPCQFVGITTGVEPNISILGEDGPETSRGILVNEFLETSVPGVYAIGDCAELRQPPAGRRAVEPVWYVGRMMGEALGKTLAGIPTRYEPGIWFNSAKFFDIEYQTYGLVAPHLQEGEADFVWLHPSENRCLHVVFDRDNHGLKGVNALGIRLRHEVVDAWIEDKKPVEEVIRHLDQANFDPEFSRPFVIDIKEKFLQQFPGSFVLPKRSWIQTVFQG